MRNPKCGLCNQGAAKRYCPALDKTICPVCCGKGRLKSIPCKDDCRFLEGVAYQQMREKERTIRGLMEKIPHGEHHDVYHDPEAAVIAFGFETFFSDCYRQGLFNINDPKIKMALRELYLLKYTRLGQGLEDDFFGLLLQIYELMLQEQEHPPELVGQVLLRILYSIDSMSGGIMGDCGYLNYLKNNLTPEGAGSSTFIIEDKFGKKTIKSKKTTGE
jgi:hypothetical protein